MQQLTETHHLMIKVYPVIHFAKLHIANHMVHRSQPCGLGFVLDGSIGGRELTFVICAVNEDVQCFTVCVNCRTAINAMIIFFFAWRPCRFAATRCCGFPCFFNIIHFERDHFHAVTMYKMMRCQRAGGRVGRRNDKPRPPRFQHIRSKVAVASFKSRICNGLEAESLPPIVHGVPGVAYVEMNMVNGFDLQEIRLFGHRAGFSDCETVVAI